MDQDFYNDEFDSFLKQKADEYYMYPTETVWNKVKNNLFWRKNWLSVATSILALCLLFFIPESFFSGIFTSHTTTDNPVKEGSATQASPSSYHKINHLKSIRGKLFDSIQTASASLSGTTVTGSVLPLFTNTPPLSVATQSAVQQTGLPAPVASPSGESTLLSAIPVRTVRPSTSLSLWKKDNDIDVASHFTVTKPAEKTEEVTKLPEIEELPQADEGIANFLQDMALIKLTPKKQGRFNLQFYFSPLVSYRTLTDNNDKTNNSQGTTPRAMNQININQYVDHQPSVGVELGSNLLFRATKNLTIKTGLQMNYSRYTIKAYRSGYQKASIALFSPIGDTITSYTTIRNFDGYLQEQLQNQYVQVSVPIGAEYKLLGNKRLQINIAGTIQPTLLLFNDTYLLSTDYMNYTKEPTLVRKWNMHTSAEAYISYQFANVRWQVGPQFRYQLLSSYNDRYPIHEYLMEYGLKFGISKTLR